ncbi:MAG: ABC transporter permease [Kiritimatiellae bacterium]|nr:ABC transporter permease [Kiritimatiellia bacterium]MBR5588416.1 ABC transporter permease [Kiritimatiellia bacterium]
MFFKKASNFFVGLPTFVWLLLFYALPVLIVFFLAFKPVDSAGGIASGWTLATLKELGNPNYPAIIWRTFWLGIVSTVVCIAVAIPISYYLSRMSSQLRNVFLMLIIVPFWTNFLIRIYAWRVFLHSDGIFKHLLMLVGLADESTVLLYNQWAVLTVMIYTYIPFAVLPIYAVAEKFDFSLLDAAKDLGAGSFHAFRRVFLPGISKGVWTAVMVVLIPAFGAYLIPDLVGGPTSELVGDKIAQRVFVDRNLPHASALSALLMLAVFLPLVGTVWIRKLKSRKAELENA